MYMYVYIYIMWVPICSHIFGDVQMCQRHSQIQLRLEQVKRDRFDGSDRKTMACPCWLSLRPFLWDGFRSPELGRETSQNLSHPFWSLPPAKTLENGTVTPVTPTPRGFSLGTGDVLRCFGQLPGGTRAAFRHLGLPGPSRQVRWEVAAK